MPPSPGSGVLLSGSLRHAIDEAQKSNKLVVTSSILLTIPPQITSLANLTHLDLTSNCLKFLPREIGQLRALTCLRLGWNKLSFLPAEIGHLSSLQELCLGFNQLRSLPRQLGCLASLQRLQLNDNCLEDIPPEIGLLAKLTECQLSYNALECLPLELGLLHGSLGSLVLSGNPLQHPGPEIVTDGTQAVLHHLREAFDSQGCTAPEAPTVEEATAGGRNMPANVLVLDEEPADGPDTGSPGGSRLPGSPSLSRQRSGSGDGSSSGGGSSPRHKSRGHAGTRSAGRSSRKGAQGGAGSDRPATAMPSLSASFSALSPLSSTPPRPSGTSHGSSPGLTRPITGSPSHDRPLGSSARTLAPPSATSLASSSSGLPMRRPLTATSAASLRRPGSASALSRQVAAAGDEESAGAMLASLPILQGSLAAAAHSLSRIRGGLAGAAPDGASSRLEALREASAQGGEGGGEAAELDCVRDLLRSRNPDLLRSLDALIEDDDDADPAAAQQGVPSWRSSFHNGGATGSGGAEAATTPTPGDKSDADERQPPGNVLATADAISGTKGFKIPPQYLCPITYEVMRDPVVAADGRTYERQAILKWFVHHGTSPVTGEELPSLDVTNNFTLRSMIREFEECQQGGQQKQRDELEEGEDGGGEVNSGEPYTSTEAAMGSL